MLHYFLNSIELKNINYIIEIFKTVIRFSYYVALTAFENKMIRRLNLVALPAYIIIKDFYGI